MAGPYTLEQAGESVSIETWEAPKPTKLCVQSLDTGHYAGVTVRVLNPGNHQEEVGTTGGGTNCIERYWGGSFIRVTNSRNDRTVAVKVWTI